MKEFIFDEYQHCINPNRIEVGNKEYFIEIQTAYHDGFWYYGDRRWTRGNSMETEVALNTTKYNTEREAIINGIDKLVDFLNYVNKRPYFCHVPDFIFKELKDLQVKTRNPQLNIF